MEVWDPKDKPTVFRRIKKAIEERDRGLKVTRYIIYPGVLFILFFSACVLLSGCATMEWPWKKEVTTIKNDLVIVVEETDDTANIIACIKLQPECKYDQED